MEHFDQDKILQYLSILEKKEACSEHKFFFEWANETTSLVEKIEKIGEIHVPPSTNPYELQYWEVDAPIQLDMYPYYGCDVLKCKSCGTVFFYYLELGGHGAQKRYRVIRRELIDPVA